MSDRNNDLILFALASLHLSLWSLQSSGVTTRTQVDLEDSPQMRELKFNQSWLDVDVNKMLHAIVAIVFYVFKVLHKLHVSYVFYVFHVITYFTYFI